MPQSKEPDVIEISNAGTTARINQQNKQLISLIRQGKDVMWKGGAPEGYKPGFGWPNSEIMMFPIIGPAPNGEIAINGKHFRMDKHGIARDLPWQIADITPNQVAMAQTYEANTEVRSSKGVISTFPLSYGLLKAYSINERGRLKFEIELENRSEEVLPFFMGWHPAFVAQENSFLISVPQPKGLKITELEEVKLARGNVMFFRGADAMVYGGSSFDLLLRHDFGYGTQVWNKEEGPVALEPISEMFLSRLEEGEETDLALMKKSQKLEVGKKARFTAELEIIRPN